jgi:hypothetical protein
MFVFELLQIEAWSEGEGWSWNGVHHIDTCKTSGDLKAAFLYQLKKRGVVCKRGACRVVDEGDVLTLEHRKTREPLFAAVVINQ